MEAIISQIIPFSNVDGLGNRIAIFLQGCNFNCWYCHNPHTINQCKHCGLCVQTCPTQALTMEDSLVKYDITKCVNCDECIKTCKHNSSPKVSSYTPETLYNAIKKYLPFTRGITFSGGECMLQAEFISEFSKLVSKEILIDSNGSIDFSKYPELLNSIGGVMLDYKASNDEFHQRLCNYTNEMVINNIKYLLNNNKLKEVRIVILPNYECENLNTINSAIELVGKNVPIYLQFYRNHGVRVEYQANFEPNQHTFDYGNLVSKYTSKGYQIFIR